LQLYEVLINDDHNTSFAKALCKKYDKAMKKKSRQKDFVNK
jgi:hypothetical protein